MTAPRTGSLRVALLVLLACLLGVLGFLAVAGSRQLLADRHYHPIRVPSAAAPAAALAGALSTAPPASIGTDPNAPQPSPAGIAAALAGRLDNADLGPSVSAQVVDALTGRPLFGRRADAVVAPASTGKLLTAAAVLSAYQPTDRFRTTVLAGESPGTVVLVGGGDPTLSAALAGQPTTYPEAGRISELASKVRAALNGAPVTQVLVDDSLFTGPTTAPGWAPEDTPSSYASQITATMVDGGRDTPTAEVRSGNPALAAGNALAKALGGAQVGLGNDGARANARILGSEPSAPVGVLVEQMLRDSDDVLAEVLTRQVALASHQPASFAGGVAAIRSVLAPLGISAGTGMRDGSGLSVLDRLPAGALTQVLVKAETAERLRPVLSGLSVAGWDGSLVEQNRFTGPAADAAGAVRAKTGSLTGVSALAGVVTDADGRQLIFAFVADRAPSEGPTRVAIDNLAAALVACGCR